MIDIFQAEKIVPDTPEVKVAMSALCLIEEELRLHLIARDEKEAELKRKIKEVQAKCPHEIEPFGLRLVAPDFEKDAGESTFEHLGYVCTMCGFKRYLKKHQGA